MDTRSVVLGILEIVIDCDVGADFFVLVYCGLKKSFILPKSPNIQDDGDFFFFFLIKDWGKFPEKKSGDDGEDYYADDNVFHHINKL